MSNQFLDSSVSYFGLTLTLSSGHPHMLNPDALEVKDIRIEVSQSQSPEAINSTVFPSINATFKQKLQESQESNLTITNNKG